MSKTSKVKEAGKKTVEAVKEHKGIIVTVGVVVLAVLVCKMDFTKAQRKMNRIMEVLKEEDEIIKEEAAKEEKGNEDENEEA